MLIFHQRPDATHVAGYRTWKSLGRFVKKGERGIAIRAPIVRRKKDETEDKRELFGFRVVYVFDIAQTDGEPLPERPNAKGEPGLFAETLHAYVTGLGIEIEYSNSIPGLGRSFGGRITLRENLEAAEEFVTLAHELAHELMHHHDTPDKRICEAEAEATAFVVARSVGLDPDSGSSDYILSWGGDRQTLSSSLNRIQKTAAPIIEAVAA